ERDDRPEVNSRRPADVGAAWRPTTGAVQRHRCLHPRPDRGGIGRPGGSACLSPALAAQLDRLAHALVACVWSVWAKQNEPAGGGIPAGSKVEVPGGVPTTTEQLPV